MFVEPRFLPLYREQVFQAKRVTVMKVCVAICLTENVRYSEAILLTAVPALRKIDVKVIAFRPLLLNNFSTYLCPYFKCDLLNCPKQFRTILSITMTTCTDVSLSFSNAIYPTRIACLNLQLTVVHGPFSFSFLMHFFSFCRLFICYA